jgi:hypothetical protein
MERKSFLKKFIGGIVGVSLVDFTKPFDATEMPSEDKTKDYINKQDFEKEVRNRERNNAFTEKYATAGYITYSACSADMNYFLESMNKQIK